MFQSFVAALIVSMIGIIPSLLKRSFTTAAIIGGIGTIAFTLINYFVCPAFTGFVPFVAVGHLLIVLILAVIVDVVASDELIGTDFIAPGSVAAFLFICVLATTNMCNSSHFAGMIGEVEERTWTQDIQPKDPKHVRLVSKELAIYLATKQLGESEKSIGSQFHVSQEAMTLQLVNGDLWYVAPLEFSGFSVWTSADVTPGYVMVHGEDPTRQAIVKLGHKFRYMPSACLWDNLERHLWTSGYLFNGLTDYSFELDDENGKPWWVVTVYEPTAAWSAKKVTGVVIVDPETGDISPYAPDNIPEWVDRVVPDTFVQDYLTWSGELNRGWINSWWGTEGLTEPETPSMVFGSDGKRYWVTGITSNSDKDQSLVGLMYTDTRTGKSIYYKAVGGTDAAVVQAIQNKLSPRKWHATDPVMYNIYGVMTAISPLLGENHTFQGVAFVDVANMQVAIGGTLTEAIREYQKILSETGNTAVAPEAKHDVKELSGTVLRFAAENKQDGTIYYLYLDSAPTNIFTAGSEIDATLPITNIGDRVAITFLDSGEDVRPLNTFENITLPVTKSEAQAAVNAAAVERKEEVRTDGEAKAAKVDLETMSAEELIELREIKERQAEESLLK